MTFKISPDTIQNTTIRVSDNKVEHKSNVQLPPKNKYESNETINQLLFNTNDKHQTDPMPITELEENKIYTVENLDEMIDTNIFSKFVKKGSSRRHKKFQNKFQKKSEISESNVPKQPEHSIFNSVMNIPLLNQKNDDISISENNNDSEQVDTIINITENNNEDVKHDSESVKLEYHIPVVNRVQSVEKTNQIKHDMLKLLKLLGSQQ